MARRLLLACLVGCVISGISFYVAYFAGLMYTAATGPLNPANDPHLQTMLRHVALPVCLALGLTAFLAAFLRLGVPKN